MSIFGRRMINNFFIRPFVSLQPFVDDYILSTSNGNLISFSGHWPASNETSLIFYLAEKPHQHLNENQNSLLTNKNNCVVGLLTRYNGIINFSGEYHTFIIQFKANGFSKIFRMPMNEFTDRIFAIEEVFGKETHQLYEQLLNSADIQQMASFTDWFLLSFMERYKKTDQLHDGVTSVAKELYNTTNLLSIAQYAGKANMSIRNFERRFMEQVGISPKLYAKLVRFNEAIKIKLMQPAKNWTSIAHECGYFDQMHLIKDFKQFSNFSPTDFFQKNKELSVRRSDTMQPSNQDFDPTNDNAIIEKFVFVRRALSK